MFAMLIVGIDIGKYHHEAAILDSNENRFIGTKPLRFTNTLDGFNELLAYIEKYNQNSCEIVFGMEATGHYWLALYSRLSERGFTVYVINPIQTDSLRNMYIRKTKTDTIDCQLVARVIQLGEYNNSSQANEELLELKELGRMRLSYSDTVGTLKRQVIGLLDKVFPEYQQLFDDVFGATSMGLLMEYSTPEEFELIDTDKLTQTIEKLSKGRLGIQRANQIKSAAQTSFGLKIGVTTTVFHIRQLLEQIKFIEKQVKEVEQILEQRLKKLNSVITSIPGIGTVIGSVILSEIGDISRFNDASKLAAFAGIDPSVRQSGEFTGTKNKMSKRGSPYLRRVLWLAATNAIKTDPALKAVYDKKRSEGKHYYIAISAVCRKLCNIIYAVLRDNKPYRLVLQTP